MAGLPANRLLSRTKRGDKTRPNRTSPTSHKSHVPPDDGGVSTFSWLQLPPSLLSPLESDIRHPSSAQPSPAHRRRPGSLSTGASNFFFLFFFQKGPHRNSAHVVKRQTQDYKLASTSRRIGSETSRHNNNRRRPFSVEATANPPRPIWPAQQQNSTSRQHQCQTSQRIEERRQDISHAPLPEQLHGVPFRGKLILPQPWLFSKIHGSASAGTKSHKMPRRLRKTPRRASLVSLRTTSTPASIP